MTKSCDNFRNAPRLLCIYHLSTSFVPSHSRSLPPLLNASQWRTFFRGRCCTMSEWTARVQPCVTGVICSNKDFHFCPNSHVPGCNLWSHVLERFELSQQLLYVFNHTKREHLTHKNGLLIGPFSCQKKKSSK